MKTLLLALLLPVFAMAQSMEKPPLQEVDAVKMIASGQCGTLDLGRGLVKGEGWIHQPIPGNVEVRIEGKGLLAKNRVTQPSKAAVYDMSPGRPYYILITGYDQNTKLTWKVPGYQWGRVPLGFQLPPLKAKAAK